MTLNRPGFKEYVTVLICLAIIGNWLHAPVVCLGANGHIELESAFHERCHDTACFQTAHEDPRLHTSNTPQNDKHCGHCIDIPVPVHLINVSRTTKSLDTVSASPLADVASIAQTQILSTNTLAANFFAAIPYFTPLRTVILLA